MELFTVDCTTCQARLKVRDASAIGQILACPKCGSMVLIEPPAGWRPTDDTATSRGMPMAPTSGPTLRRKSQSTPATLPIHNTFDEAAALFSDDAAPLGESFTAGPSAGEALDTTSRPKDGGELHPVGPSSTPSDRPPDKASPASDGSSGKEKRAAESRPPTGAERLAKERQSTKARRARKAAAAAAAVTASAVARPGAGASPGAAAATGAGSPATMPAEAASAGIADAAAASSAPLLPTAAWTSPLVRRWQQGALIATGAAAGVALAVIAVGLMIRFQLSGRERQDTEKGSTDAVAQAGDHSSSGANDTTDGGGTDEEPDTSATDIDSHADESTGAADTSQGDEAAGSGASVTDDSGGGDSSDTGDSTNVASGGAVDADEGDGPPGLIPADDDRGTDDGAPKPIPFLDELSRLAPPAAAGLAAGLGVDLEDDVDGESSIVSRPEPPRVDVAARLADPVAGIEFRETPLGSLLRLITSISTIPISVDFDALARTKTTLAAPVSLQLSDTNVGGVLEAALEPYGLDVVEDDGHLIVTTPPTEGEPRVREHSVADLTAGDAESPQELADLVIAFVAPLSWESVEAAGTIAVKGDALVVSQAGKVQYEVALFLDRLRVARGMAPRGDFLRPQLTTAPRAEAARERLAAPIKANFFQPTPLVHILPRLEEQAAVHIVVDWRAAARVGWSPQSETTLSCNAQPLGDALVAMLEPMDLTYRVVDESTLEITTVQGMSSLLETEFYPAGDLVGEALSGQQIVDSLSAAMGRHWLRGGAGGAIHFDQPSGCLIVALPPSAHAHLSRMIDALREKHR